MLEINNKRYTIGMQKAPYFIGIDIGTSKVRCAIGMPENENPDKPVSIIGLGSAVNNGMRKGCVSHPQDVARAIVEAVAEAERTAGIKVDSATININGASVNAQNSRGLISSNSQDKTITAEDLLRVDDQSTLINLPSNRDIVQYFAKEYKVDGQGGIKDPVGMSGIRLEVESLVVTAGLPCIKGLEEAMNDAQIDISSRTVSGVASAEVSLERRQKESGTAIIDIGAGTTNIAIIEDGEIVSIDVLPIGGMNITHDLAIGLKADLDFAEKVKKKIASLKESAGESKILRVSHEGKTHEIDTARIYDIIVPRFDEIFEEIDKVFAKSGKSKSLPGGVVIVGGVANTPGLADFALQKLQLHTRIGNIKGVGGLADTINQAEYSTVVGLMLADRFNMFDSHEHTQKNHNNRGGGLFNKLKQTFKS